MPRRPLTCLLAASLGALGLIAAPSAFATSVNITAPADGANVSGTITVTATASDSVRVDRVMLRVDGAWVATDSAAPWSFSYATGALSDGPHSIELRAWGDSSADYASDTIGVTKGAVTTPTGTFSGNYTEALVNSLDFPCATCSSSAMPRDVGRVEEIVRSGSTVYIGGNFTQTRKSDGTVLTKKYLVAADAITGAYKSAFNPTVNGRVTALEVTPDGSTVFIGGTFTTVNGVAMKGLAALDPATGALKSGALANMNVSGEIEDITSNATSVYIGGQFSNVGGQARTNIARFDLASGKYTLNSWKANVAGKIMAMEVDPDRSRVVIGGSFESVAGNTANHDLAALKYSDGTPTAWADHSIPTGGSNRVIDLDVTSSGIYVAQGGSNWTRAYDFAGNERWTFNSDGDNQGIAVQGNKVIVGFHGNKTAPRPNISYQSVDSAERPTRDKVFMLDAQTGALQAWNPSLKAPDGSPLGVWTIESSPTMLYLGGDFTKVETTQQERFAMFPSA